MEKYSWIWQLSAGGALIFFFYLVLHFVLKDLKDTLSGLSTTLLEMEKNMTARDQIILNHLGHFAEQVGRIAENQRQTAELINKICKEFGINGKART